MKVRHVEVRTGAKRSDKKTVVVEYRSQAAVSQAAATPLQVVGRTYFAPEDDTRRDARVDKTGLTVSLEDAAQVSRVRRGAGNKRRR
jgi:hypothetical protein